MKLKEQMQMNRADAAARLREIADMIESGSVSISDTAVQIPDDVKLEFEFEEKAGKAELEIELEWRKQAV